MKKKITRRALLKAATLASSGTLIACLNSIKGPTPSTQAAAEAQAEETILHYLPMLRKAGTPTPVTPTPKTPTPETPTPETPTPETPTPDPNKHGRVVHVHANNCHTWSSGSNYYDFVSQSVVDEMVDEGMKRMTGQSTWENAWKSLLPNYTRGQLVAIKVSFNNNGTSSDIDGIIEPVNAIIRGLKAAGVENSSIIVFDSSRSIPSARFSNRCLYLGVNFLDKYDSPWKGAKITFHPPSAGALTLDLSNVLVEAKYLINVPVMKRHGMAGLSNTFKNHYGSIDDPTDLHRWTSMSSTTLEQYSPLVELYQNANINGKTILTVGDGIFAAKDNNDAPTTWKMFNNQTPKSLFLSTDPVAVDSIMGDLVANEDSRVPDKAFAYLALAEKAGLGVHERGDPFSDTYKKIDYQKIEI